MRLHDKIEADKRVLRRLLKMEGYEKARRCVMMRLNQNLAKQASLPD